MGPEDGLPLVFHDGTPTAAAPFPQVSEPAARHGLRTINYSRPGYANSTEMLGRSVADAARDTEAVVRFLGGERYVTLGWSGGGPHALACAALSPGQCLAAATLASVAPYGAEGLDWLDGMGPENVEEFGATLQGIEAETAYQREAPAFEHVTGGEVAAALGGLVSEVDKASLTGEFAEAVAESFRRAVRPGIAGWRDDDLAFAKDWGFDLGAIEVPVSIWQGAHDRMVPFAHGKWLAAHIPNAREHLYEEEGHLSLVGQLERIIADLVDAAGLDRSV